MTERRGGVPRRVLAAWAVLLAASGAAAAQTVGYGVAVSGAYDRAATTRSDSGYLFASVDVAAGPARLMLSVPFVHTVTTKAPAERATTRGVGDPLVRLDLRLWHQPEREFQLGTAAALKVPVVDAATGRGTGEADVGVGASAFKAAGRTSFLADVLYWRYGDPDGIDFANTWSYSVGAARIIGRGRASAMASVSGFSSGVVGESPPVSLNVGLLSLVARGQSVALSASVGLTESASDLSIGTSWRITR